MTLSEFEDKMRKHAACAKSTVAAPFDIESEDLTMIIKTKSLKRTVLLTAAIIAVLGTTVFAAYHFLTPSEIAKHTGNYRLEEAFKKDGVSFNIPPQQSGDYTIQLLGMTSGENLSFFSKNGIVSDNMTYIVGAISRTDGGELSDYPGIMLSPLVSGYKPWDVNIFTLGGGKSEFISEDDKTDYFIYECNNLEVFADHTVYIALYEGLAPSADIFTQDENGLIHFNSEYKGVKAIFEVPFDKTKADPEKAAAFVNGLDENADMTDDGEQNAENADSEEIELMFD